MPKCSVCAVYEAGDTLCCESCKREMLEGGVHDYTSLVLQRVASLGVPPQRGNNCTDNSQFFALRYLGHSKEEVEKEFRHSFRLSKLSSDTYSRLNNYLQASVVSITDYDVLKSIIQEDRDVVIVSNATANHAFPIFKIGDNLFAYNQKAKQFSSSYELLDMELLKAGAVSMTKWSRIGGAPAQTSFADRSNSIGNMSFPSGNFNS